MKTKFVLIQAAGLVTVVQFGLLKEGVDCKLKLPAATGHLITTFVPSGLIEADSPIMQAYSLSVPLRAMF